MLHAAGAFAGRRVWCFGHTQATLELLHLFAAAGITVHGILDNSRAKQGSVVAGVTIVAPAAFLETATEQDTVCIASRAYAAMARQLTDGGFRGRIEKLRDFNTFADYSLASDVRAEKAARAERGRALWRELRQAHPAPCYVVFPFGTLGDVCHAMGYLDAWCARERIRARQIVVAGATSAQVVALYGETAVSYPQAQMDELVQGALAEQAADVHIIHHDRPYTNYMIRLLRNVFVPFDAFYRDGVYGLPQETKPVLPSHFAAPTDDYGIQPGQAVILAPQAKSVTELPQGFWETEVAHWQAAGKQVYTNVAPGEKPLTGTQSLDVSLAELQPLAERAGTFVALRSGICDVLAAAHCRKIVYFPDARYSDTPWPVAAFFHMDGWENIIVRKDGSKQDAKDDAGIAHTFHAAENVDL